MSGTLLNDTGLNTCTWRHTREPQHALALAIMLSPSESIGINATAAASGRVCTDYLVFGRWDRQTDRQTDT